MRKHYPTRLLVVPLTLIAILLAPYLYPVWHLEDPARFVDVQSLRFDWTWVNPVDYVLCWPVIGAEVAISLVAVGGFLAWAVRRERRREAAA